MQIGYEPLATVAMQMDTSNRRYARDDDPRDDDLATRGDGRDDETATSLLDDLARFVLWRHTL